MAGQLQRPSPWPTGTASKSRPRNPIGPNPGVQGRRSSSSLDPAINHACQMPTKRAHPTQPNRVLSTGSVRSGSASQRPFVLFIKDAASLASPSRTQPKSSAPATSSSALSSIGSNTSRAEHATRQSSWREVAKRQQLLLFPVRSRTPWCLVLLSRCARHGPHLPLLSFFIPLEQLRTPYRQSKARRRATPPRLAPPRTRGSS